MFSSEETSEIYCNESTMNNVTENYWNYDGNQNPTNYQSFNAGQDVAYNMQDWCPSHIVPEVTHTSQNIQIGNNSFNTFTFPQHDTTQYVPLTPEPAPQPMFYLPNPQLNSGMAKRHRAQITFVPTKNGTFKAIVKRKRKRTVFTTEQVQALESIFKTKPYISREDRQVIVKQLQLNDKAVKVWFQNRRLKGKRGSEHVEEEHETEPLIEERNAPNLARLEYVESQINAKTDEFGYVTLDDSVMKNLFNVIDDFLTNEPKPPVEEVAEIESSPIYEPISPASVYDSNEEDNGSNWKPSEPNESLQRLFDIQNMLVL